MCLLLVIINLPIDHFFQRNIFYRLKLCGLSWVEPCYAFTDEHPAAFPHQGVRLISRMCCTPTVSLALALSPMGPDAISWLTPPTYSTHCTCHLATVRRSSTTLPPIAPPYSPSIASPYGPPIAPPYLPPHSSPHEPPCWFIIPLTTTLTTFPNIFSTASFTSTISPPTIPTISTTTNTAVKSDP